MTPSHNRLIDAAVEAAMQEGSIPGLALAVVQGGSLTLAKAYGLANLEHQVPATTRTVFRVASITKTFTATAIMMLVEQGRVNLDDPVHQHFSNLPDAWRAITVRHLLSHTSGLPGYETMFRAAWEAGDPYDRIIPMVAVMPLVFQPGAAWGYCNTNYVLLGLLIEQVTGTPYREWMRERLFVPLGMTDTRLNRAEEVVPNRAQGYAWEGQTLTRPGQPPLRKKENPSPGLWDYADGGILSTVQDLACWEAALCTEALLSRDSLDRMWNPARLNDGRTVEYGLGWIVKVVQGHRYVGHWGRLPGFIAEMSRFPDDALTVIAFCNRWNADLARLVIQVADLYVPGLKVRSDGLPALPAYRQSGMASWQPFKGEEDDWARGILEVSPQGWGFLRRGDLPPIYVSIAQIRKFSLKEGDWVGGKVRAPREDEKYFGLLRVETVNDREPD